MGIHGTLFLINNDIYQPPQYSVIIDQMRFFIEYKTLKKGGFLIKMEL